MRRAAGALTAALLLGFIAVPSAPSVAADGAVQHRVFVAYVSNGGPYTDLRPDMIAAGVDAALERWRAMAPSALASLTRVGEPVPYAAPPAMDGGCGFVDLPGVDHAEFADVESAVGMGHAPAGVVEHLVLVVPPCSDGHHLGEGATQGESFVSGGDVVLVDNASNDEAVGMAVVENLGHNFGLGQADIGCAPGTTCERWHHTDCYSPMGLGSRLNLGTAARADTGILEPGEMTTLGGVSGPVDQVVTLRPRGESSGLRGAAVVDPESGQTYYLDYRAFVGLDDDSAGLPGCHEGLVVTELSSRRTTLVRPRGNFSVGNFDQMAWGAGDSIPLSSPVGIDVLSLDPADGARVRVRVTPGPPFDRIGKVSFQRAPAQASTVSALVTAFSPVPDWLSYRWYADGELITSPNFFEVISTSWAMVPDDALNLEVEVTAHRAGRSYAVARAVSPVTKNLVRSSRPVIEGRLAVGHRVHLIFHRKPSGPGRLKMRTRWYADGRLVANAKGRSLLLPQGLAGKHVVVVVTIRGKEVVKAVRKSRPSPPVKR